MKTDKMRLLAISLFVGAFVVLLWLSGGAVVPQAAAQSGTDTPTATTAATPTPTTMPTLTPTATDTPTPTPTSHPPFIIRGQVLDILDGDGGPLWPLINVLVTYKDPNSGQELGTSTLYIQPNGNWEFNEFPDVPLDQWPLPDTVTFDITFYTPSDMAAPVEAQAGAVGTVQGAGQIILDRVSRGTYQGNIFYTDASGLYTTLAGCPIESIVTDETEHFAIRWCNAQNHPSYPPGGDAGLRRRGE